MKSFFRLLFLLSCSCSWAIAPAPEAENPTPWLTGSLLAPYGAVIPRGTRVAEPYLFGFVTTGIYGPDWKVEKEPNLYSIIPEINLLMGITPWMDFQIVPSVVYNRRQGQSSTHLKDTLFGFDFQLRSIDLPDLYPGVKLFFGGWLPTGKYQKLNPDKLGTDLTGSGAYGGIASIVFYKIYRFTPKHHLSFDLSFTYTAYTKVHVQGMNAFGGNPDTDGNVNPGSSFNPILSFEFTLNKHWVLALDNFYLHTNKSPFSGSQGIVPVHGTTHISSAHSSEQVSFAPAIEYNFNINSGIIGGCWFTAYGRNTAVFRSGVIAYYCVF